MPELLYYPTTRRAFLHTALLGGAAVVASGCRAPRTSAARPELHLALLSDTHIPGDRVNGHRGFNPWENLRQVVPAVLAARPEGLVLNGDAARLEGKVEDYRELKALLDPVAALCPVYIGLGNHDNRGPFREVFRQPPGLRPSVAGRQITVIDHEAARVIVLDSLQHVNQASGLLGKDQRAWLATYLPTLADRPVALVVHHTLGDGDGDLLDADRLFALLKPHRHVRAIFYGHSHVWALGERQGLRLINLPALGYNFRDADPVGWVDARFRGDGVSLTLHAIGGQRSDDGKTTFVRWT